MPGDLKKYERVEREPSKHSRSNMFVRPALVPHIHPLPDRRFARLSFHPLITFQIAKYVKWADAASINIQLSSPLVTLCGLLGHANTCWKRAPLAPTQPFMLADLTGAGGCAPQKILEQDMTRRD
jgi:hypothetical protein